MDKIAKNLQLALMVIILISTVIAVGIEMKNMFLNQSVTLADLLLMFLYLEVLAMVRFFGINNPLVLPYHFLLRLPPLHDLLFYKAKKWILLHLFMKR
jgi:protein PsiE